jgi:hypothetical protein
VISVNKKTQETYLKEHLRVKGEKHTQEMYFDEGMYLTWLSSLDIVKLI